jgi:hypothetical protein
MVITKLPNSEQSYKKHSSNINSTNNHLSPQLQFKNKDLISTKWEILNKICAIWLRNWQLKVGIWLTGIPPYHFYIQYRHYNTFTYNTDITIHLHTIQTLQYIYIHYRHYNTFTYNTDITIHLHTIQTLQYIYIQYRHYNTYLWYRY